MNLPEIPYNQRPKRLPHNGLTKTELKEAAELGWTPFDVRTMPNQSDADRAESVKAHLEGVRLGTILPDAQILKFLELEARIYGLSSGKAAAAANTKGFAEDGTIDSLLDFGKAAPWAARVDEKPTRTKRPPGRPNTYKRKKVAKDGR